MRRLNALVLKRWQRAFASLAVTLSIASGVHAQGYLTEGYDASRTGWVKEEKILTKSNIDKVKMLWRVQLPSIQRNFHDIHTPLVIEGLQTPNGVKEVAIVAGIDDQLFGLDAKTGELLWTKQMEHILGGLPDSTNRLCPNGQTSIPTIEKTADGKYKVWALAGDGRVWEVDPATGKDLAPPQKWYQTGNFKSYALNMTNGYLVTSTSQGCGGHINAFGFFNTRDGSTMQFAPIGGGMWGRRGVAVDSQGAVWIGTGGARFQPQGGIQGPGTLATSIVGVKPNPQTNTVDLVGAHSAYNSNWIFKRDLDISVSPSIFTYQGKEMAVYTHKTCRVHLVDLAAARAAGAKVLRKTLDTSSLICNDRQLWDENGAWGAITTAQDSAGKQWVFVPFWGEKSREFNPPVINTPAVPGGRVWDLQLSKHGGVAAFTVDKDGDGYKLTPRWVSQDMNMGEAGLFANDILWVFASGVNNRQQGREVAWNDHITPFGEQPLPGLDMGTHATIYALDAQTGKTLWNSGDHIKTWNHWNTITMADGKVMLSTVDGVVYAFGIDEESPAY
ncbi:MAG TPA: PQQ-binding-like beta-propeller repeat protein [Granulicella sp.]